YRLFAQAEEVMQRLQLDINVQTHVRLLGVGQRQLVAIARALTRPTRILILDEPTAALTDSESAVLFKLLKKLQSEGVGILYISHRLPEVFALSDRVTVLRDGQTAHTALTRELNQDQVVALMVGRELKQLFPARQRKLGEVLFEARNIRVTDPLTGKPVVDDISFAVRAGEVLGIAGLIGAGRSELLMSLFGLPPGEFSGEVVIGGKSVAIGSPAQAITHGIGFVTEDR